MAIASMKKVIALFIFCSFLLVTLFVLSIVIGPFTIPAKQVLSILLCWGNLHLPLSCEFSDQQHVVVTNVRLPRAILAILVGAALASAGVVLQALFRNPLVEPGYIGVSSGAALGAVTAIFFGATAITKWFLPLSAFLGAIVAMGIILLVWKSLKQTSVITLILLGVGLNSFFSAIMNLLIASSDNDQELRSIVYWLQGGLEAKTWEHVSIVVFPILASILLFWFFSKELNLLLLGEEQAQTVGISVRYVRLGLLITASIAASTAVAVSGIIGFVGLIVPHMMRLVVGSDHRLLIPISAITGAAFLLLADLCARMMLQPIVLQVGVVCALLGSPLFIILLYKSSKVGI